MPEQDLTQLLTQLLGSDFSDIRPLGASGGLSRLFRAHKRSLGIDVVIKRMRIDRRDPQNVKREANILTSLRHQYLPRIFDFKTDGRGFGYTIMELIPGCNLRQYVQRYGAVPQKQALIWMKQLSQALVYMHSQQPTIIHSDIKPENIMITPTGSICLIDFNTSLEVRGSVSQAIGATLCYAAPEQYNVPMASFGDPSRLPPRLMPVYNMAVKAQDQGPVTVRTDLFAVGAVAYYMLTGFDPKPWDQPQIPLSRYAITLSEPLQRVIERCMQPAAKDRFADAEELQDALQGLARLDQRYTRWQRSCRLTAVGVGAGLILSAFCCLWGVLDLRQQAAGDYNELIRQAQQAGEQMDTETQRELLLKAITVERDRPEAYANLGAMLYRQGDYLQAVDLLADIDPERTGSLSREQAASAQGQIQYVLGSCYYQMQQYDNALKAYQLAAAFCPDVVAYQRDLTICYAKLGYDQQAQQAAQVLEGMETQPGDTQLVKGEIDLAARRYQQALEQMEQVIQLSEDHLAISRAGLQASRCCRSLGDAWLEQEIQLLSTCARRLDPVENQEHLRLLADNYLRKAALEPASGREYCQKAVDQLDELILRGNPSYRVLQSAVAANQQLGDRQRAEELLLEMQRQYPADYWAFMQMAFLSMEQQDLDTFWQQYQQATEKYAGSGVSDPGMDQLDRLADQHRA